MKPGADCTGRTVGMMILPFFLSCGLNAGDDSSVSEAQASKDVEAEAWVLVLVLGPIAAVVVVRIACCGLADLSRRRTSTQKYLEALVRSAPEHPSEPDVLSVDSAAAPPFTGIITRKGYLTELFPRIIVALSPAVEISAPLDRKSVV